MDTKSFAGFRKIISNSGITPSEVVKWLEANGTSAPIIAHGATLEEPTRAVGVDGAEFAHTIERGNGLVKVDKNEDFNRLARFMKKPVVAEGTYCIVEQKVRFATTLGGVVVDTLLHILDAEGRVIPNLYVAGKIADPVTATTWLRTLLTRH